MRNKKNSCIVNKSILGIVIVALSSCMSKPNFEKIEDSFLNNLTTINSLHTLIVIPIDNEDIIIMANGGFWTFTYEEYYKSRYSSYFEFLRKLYDGKIYDLKELFDKRDIYTKIDKGVMKEYNEHGLSFITDKYLSEYEESHYVTKLETLLMDKSVTSTVVMIMFINENYIYFDDAIGNYLFQKKLDELPNVDDIVVPE